MQAQKTICSPVYYRTPVPFAQRVYHFYSGLGKLEKAILNCADTLPEADDSLDFRLRQVMNAIKLEAMSDDGTGVDYGKLSASTAYEQFRNLTVQLQRFPLKKLHSRDQKLAFWINIYNVMVVDAVIQFGVRKSVQEKRGFFVKAAYVIDGYRFSADDVEHGILRANQGNPAIPGGQFGGNDPRLALQMPRIDPRIHFTLVCASSSCPPIGFYRPENIDEQLDLAARNFINGGEVEVNVEEKTVRLSKIFQWYAPDFGGSFLNQLGFGDFSTVLRFVTPFISDEFAREALEKETQAFKVSFKAYDWGLNILH